ncbi:MULTISPECIES: metal ABC transporter permease [unclassified Curtobacterium]|uniref:metal ABC transporter permease n=1 Tax=unclassified Curtobacterium TaxID=257496 RepID=UPI000DA76228|nr:MULTISPECIES: metal ABC transporter permease [unclassified Curtobacterium]WIB63396.1 metal ABC transporter permease [Curtobacterium sp. MCBD17_040]WIE54412.1 metal ABC transporter permease [Curtobacterium sp. MCBD17_003]
MTPASVIGGFLGSPTIHTALVVGGFVALVTGIVGVFTIVRGQSFAGHALADLGAVGGSGAFLIGISQVWGFIGAGVLAALLMELIGVRRLQGRDVSTGIVFGFGLGLTALFLYWSTTIGGSSNAAVSVLFGSLFVIAHDVIPLVVGLSVVALALVAATYRWLLMESLDHGLAAARGVPVRITGIVFLVALALAVELSSLTIGAILSTALLIGPAATALLLTRRFGTAVLVSAALAVLSTWAGCFVSFESYSWAGHDGNWPVSFCIVAIILVVYLAIRVGVAVRRHRMWKPARVGSVRGSSRAQDTEEVLP